MNGLSFRTGWIEDTPGSRLIAEESVQGWRGEAAPAFSRKRSARARRSHVLEWPEKDRPERIGLQKPNTGRASVLVLCSQDPSQELKKAEQPMKRAKTPTFLLELPLRLDWREPRRVRAHLEAAR